MEYNKKETPTFFLWLGCIAYITGLLLSFFFNSYEVEKEQTVNYIHVIYFISPVVYLILGCIIIPIVEEILFRLWTLQVNRAFILSIIWIPIILFACSRNILLSILSGVVLLCIFLFAKKRTTQIWLWTFATSVLFTLLHFYNFSSFSQQGMFMFIQIFGLSFLLCYVALRFHILYAMALHIFNNCIAMFVFFLCLNPTPKTTIDSSAFTLSLDPLSVFQAPRYNVKKQGDTLTVKGSITDIASYFIDHNNENNPLFSDEKYMYLNLDNNKIVPQYQMSFIPKEHIGYVSVLDSLKAHTRLVMDTTFTKAYTLRIQDFDKLSEKSEKNGESNLKELEYQIRSQCQIPVVLDFDVNELYPVYFDYNLLGPEYTKKNINLILNPYGLMLDTVPNRTVYVITLKTSL